MTISGQERLRVSERVRHLAKVGFALVLASGIAIPSAQAQKYTVIHNFTGGNDGALPRSTLIVDRAGNLYGTAGPVFKMSHAGSGWVYTPLFIFPGGYDGSGSGAAIAFGPDSSLYGTADGGDLQCSDGEGGGCGIVFNLKPPPTRPASFFSPWKETVLHAFAGRPSDGEFPWTGAIIFDRAGNLYGTTEFGGNSGNWGTVFKMTAYGGGWTESVIYNLAYGTNGPYSGVVMDSAGNLYGTTGDGTVIFELSPYGDGWTFTDLHDFTGGLNDGGLAYGGLVFDSHGNLFGATTTGGAHGGGVVYELTPSNGTWTYHIIYNLPNGGPFDSLTVDAAGNLYGAAQDGGSDSAGMVFKLSQSNGVWTLTDLHDFTFDTEWFPEGGVTLDANGNLFGTAKDGGAHGWGVVWEITP